MKISSQNTGAPSSTPPSKTIATVAQDTPAAKPAAAPGNEASVASHVQTPGSVSSADAPFDSRRVAEIRQAIAEGRFQVDSGKIADKLLADVRDLLRG
jgi:negative regulator of flagellin synthesis FlgM